MTTNSIETEAPRVGAPADAFAVESTFTIKTLDCCSLSGFDGHELVVSCSDTTCGLRAYIAIHSTTLGPSLGGCRMWPYVSEAEALNDALRLSQGMSYKHAIARTKQGGGKAVIIGHPRRDKSDVLFQVFGRFVNWFGGQYVTAEDVGISVDDVTIVREQTRHVAGLPTSRGGSGDPSPVTAYGVFCGIQAAVAYQAGRQYDLTTRLDNITVAVQGLGNVGYALCRYLHDAGAELVVADINKSSIEQACVEFSAVAVEPDAIYDTDADIFAPCALGGTLNEYTVPRLKATIVAGAANNQLASTSIAHALKCRSILYAPDYVINAGGIINISYEKDGYDSKRALQHTERIGDTLTEVFERAASEDVATSEVADATARLRLHKSP